MTFSIALVGLTACGDETASAPSTSTSSTASQSSSSAGGAGGTAASSQVGVGVGGAGGSATTSGQGGSGGQAPCVPGTGTEDVGSDSIKDKATCLVWQKGEGAALNNIQAAKHCLDLSQDGFDDWRVPRTEEMATWPQLTSSGNAYVTSPTYILKTAPDDEQGCTANAHSCNLAKYSEQGAASCAWQGVGFKGPIVCVRGTAAPNSLPEELMADKCATCAPNIAGGSASFKEADCLPFAK